jgi:hypothetical protein
MFTLHVETKVDFKKVENRIVVTRIWAGCGEVGIERGW